MCSINSPQWQLRKECADNSMLACGAQFTAGCRISSGHSDDFPTTRHWRPLSQSWVGFYSGTTWPRTVDPGHGPQESMSGPDGAMQRFCLRYPHVLVGTTARSLRCRGLHHKTTAGTELTHITWLQTTQPSARDLASNQSSYHRLSKCSLW